MARTARDLVQDAAKTAGIIAAAETLNSLEADHALNELNNLVEQWNLDGYFPHTKVLSTVETDQTNVTDRQTLAFTIGQALVQNAGKSDTLVSGTITGLANLIDDNTDIPTFQDAVITLTDGTEYFVPGLSTMTEGKVSSDETFTVSVLEIIPPSTINYTAPPIPAGTTVFFQNLKISTPQGIYLNSDLFIKRPNMIRTLSFDVAQGRRALEYLTPDTFDDSSRHTVLSSLWGVYYTVRPDFPLMTIEVFPAIPGNFFLTSEIVPGPYTLDDEINLPSGYYPALQYGLASILALHYKIMDMYDALTAQATTYLARIKRLNIQPKNLSTRGRPKGFYYDIYTNNNGGLR